MKELAKSLKLERLRRGLTLAEVSERSRIGIGTLQRIEVGNFSVIGSELLITSYLRAYSESLAERHPDLDGSIRPELNGSAPNDLSWKLQQAHSRVGRWRAVAMILMIAMTGLILSEALWFLDRHPLSRERKASKQHSEALQNNPKYSKPNGKMNSSAKTDDLRVSQSRQVLPPIIPRQLQGIEIQEENSDSSRPVLREELRPEIPAAEIEEDLATASDIDPHQGEELFETSEDTKPFSETPAVDRSQPAKKEVNAPGVQQQLFPSSAGLLNELEFIDRRHQMTEDYSALGHASPTAVTRDATGKDNREPIRDELDTRGSDANILINAKVEPPLTAVQESADRKHLLEIEAIADCWVEIKIDGQKRNGDLLKAGEHRTWEVKKGVELLLGDAAGARIRWDGHPLAFLGKPGRVVRLKLPDPASIKKN